MTLRVHRETLFDESLSPLIYGDFMEPLNDLLPGMWAEKVQDRKFGGILQPNCVYPPGQNWVYPRWKAFSAGMPAWASLPHTHQELDLLAATAEFHLDAENPFNGKHSARVQATPDPSKPFIAGIAQEGIAVRKGEPLRVEVHLRAQGLQSREVHAHLGRQYGVFFRSYASLTFRGVSGEWLKFSGTLTPEVTDDAATLAIGVSEEAVFWVDSVSLMPLNAQRGWRPDVVEAIRALKPGIIRFGGSSLIYYQWEEGIGSRARRVPFENKPWGDMQENDVGIYEFLDFCELVGAEPLICLNSNSTTLEQILAEIEFCNGTADSPNGCLRAEMGRSEPFRVTYWQIGNEQSGEEYERVMVDYARAIRERHPDLVLLASYPSDNILLNLSDEVDYICPHFYAPHTKAREEDIRTLIETIRAKAKNLKLKLGITEWNHTAGSWGWGRSWLLTVYNALNAGKMFNLFHRLGDSVRIANRSNMTNSCCSGILQTSPTILTVTPCYHVQKAYANFSGNRVLRTTTDPNETLDVSATRNDSNGEIALFVVNGFSEPHSRTVQVEGAKSGDVRLWTLAGSPDALNSFAEPERVVPTESTARMSGGSLDVEFPPFSVTVVRV